MVALVTDRTDLFDRLAVVGKAFGSARRLELVDLLAQRPHSVEELAAAGAMGVTTVSAHLQILRMAGLVTTRREGRRVVYRLAGDDVLEAYSAMRAVARAHSADVAQALAAYLDAPGAEEVDTVTRDALARAVAAGEVVLLDVRPPEEYAAGHIPTAISAPLEELAGRADEWAGETRPLVAYCRGAYCVLAHDAVRLLAARGVSAVRLEDGMLEWRVAGAPVEVGA